MWCMDESLEDRKDDNFPLYGICGKCTGYRRPIGIKQRERTGSYWWGSMLGLLASAGGGFFIHRNPH